MHNLVERIVSSFLSNTDRGCTCGAHTVTKLGHQIDFISALGRDTPKWTSCHGLFLNLCDPLLQVKERIYSIVSSSLILAVFNFTLLEAEESLVDGFKIAH